MVSTANAQVLVKKNTVLMGSRFDITIVAEDSVIAAQRISQAITEIDRIEQLISDWIPGSQVSEINRAAGIHPVKVDRELFELTRRAIEISEISGGAFDISFAAMDRIWKFDGSMEELPDSATIQQAISKIGYTYIVLDSSASTIFLSRAGMKIGFGATGKGYAADKARALMQSLQVRAGIVNASGDMATWGSQQNGKPWKVGVTNPFKRNKTLKVLSIRKAAVTTSGDYQKYVEIDGKRYSHIINPKTGMPSYGLTSVTVIGPNAETANGFSTSIMVLGKEKGLQLLKRFPDYACLLLTPEGKTYTSGNFRKITRRYKYSTRSN